MKPKLEFELFHALKHSDCVLVGNLGTTEPITSKPPFPFGLMKGRIEIAEDFDAPLSNELLDAFERTHLP